MIKCPNCGSTAQVKLKNHETYVWQKEIAVYLEYQCGCGQRFVTSVITDRENEKMRIKKPIDKCANTEYNKITKGKEKG